MREGGGVGHLVNVRSLRVNKTSHWLSWRLKMTIEKNEGGGGGGTPCQRMNCHGACDIGTPLDCFKRPLPVGAYYQSQQEDRSNITERIFPLSFSIPSSHRSRLRGPVLGSGHGAYDNYI